MLYNIKFLQINVGRSRSAHDIMEVFAKEEGISIVLVSEPNENMARRQEKYMTDSKCDAAILILDQNIGIQKTVTGNGFVGIWIENLIILSVYISPNVSDECWIGVLEGMSTAISGDRTKDIIIGGDFNAKAKEWGNVYNDRRRGQLLLEWMGEQNMYCCNMGNIPTYVHGERKSCIDLAICSQNTELESTRGRAIL